MKKLLFLLGLLVALTSVSHAQMLQDNAQTVPHTGGGACSSGGGGITLVDCKGNFCAGTTCAITMNVASGNLLVVGCSQFDSGGPAAATAADTASNTFTQINVAASGVTSLTGLYAKNTSANAADAITCSTSSAADTWIVAMQYSGASTTSPLAANDANDNIGSSATTSILSAAGANEMLVAFATVGGAASCTYALTSTPGALTNEIGDSSGRSEGAQRATGASFSSTVTATISACGIGSVNNTYISAEVFKQ